MVTEATIHCFIFTGRTPPGVFAKAAVWACSAEVPALTVRGFAERLEAPRKVLARRAY